MSRNVRNVLVGVGYVWFLLMGVGLVSLGDFGPVLAGSFLLLLAVGGFVMVGIDVWVPRRRPAVRVGTAPSGAAATVFPYSRAQVLMSGVGMTVYIVWSAVGAVLSAREGYPVGAWLLALTGLGLVVPMVPLLRGRIAVGGLYVTTVGLELRQEGAGWSVPWEDVTGVVPHEPVPVLVSAPPKRHDTTTRMWRREPRTGPGMVVIDTRYLAGGPGVVAAVIGKCLVHPGQRARMGDMYVVSEINALTTT
ncbi:hypothetical protein I601_1927 [Nocardioides dokdonensis FR1436]|uniref:Uncharacterized protein n=1 Tax=Nocardioides dokdonensis FR1436 TaxID=1300347 RepID=A0A1A9GJ59_9ACTN|nr:hypothetical protein [Nocardioides dokdonensis]ANH38357.1 hypothetical protein I601_1927 [Nocardioides dokdonensis FR1436]